MEAAEKSAGQMRRYEGGSEPAAIVNEGQEHPTLRWLARGKPFDWLKLVAEVEAYNSDFQVCDRTYFKRRGYSARSARPMGNMMAISSPNASSVVEDVSLSRVSIVVSQVAHDISSECCERAMTATLLRRYLQRRRAGALQTAAAPPAGATQTAHACRTGGAQQHPCTFCRC